MSEPKKTPSGEWKVDFRPGGRYGRRVRKTFRTKNEALRFMAWARDKVRQGEVLPPWNPAGEDRRRLSELVQIWYSRHGQHLNDGERRFTALLNMTEEMGDPVASRLNAELFSRWREMKSGELSPKTLNNLHGYLNACINELARLDVIDWPNPLAKVRMLRIKENELTYLTTEQIIELLDTIRARAKNPHVHLVTRICLATGARWSEAEGLTLDRVRGNRCYFVDTKSGRNRAVPIVPEMAQEVAAHLRAHGGRFGTSTISAFRRALAHTSIELPAGQAAHVLRHTFASHFLMNGGDILTLQRILGHSSITMTMRYAHLAPDHLEDATRYNPLNHCGHFVDTFGNSAHARKKKTA